MSEDGQRVSSTRCRDWTVEYRHNAMRRLLQFVLVGLAGRMLSWASRLSARPAPPFKSKDLFGAAAARALRQAGERRMRESGGSEDERTPKGVGKSAGAAETPAADQPAPAGAAPPPGYRLMVAQSQLASPYGHAILLANPAGEFFIPVFVGPTEALAFQHRAAATSYQRPLTHDLIEALLSLFAAQLESVRIERIENDVYHATVVLRTEGRQHELDARASDAIVLAVGLQAPIFVAADVIERAARNLAELENDELAELSPFQPP